MVAVNTQSISFKEEHQLITVIATAKVPSLTTRVFYRAKAVFDKSHPEFGCQLDFR
jgi:hypothetical protein